MLSLIYVECVIPVIYNLRSKNNKMEKKMEITYRSACIDDLLQITELWDLMCNTEENCGEDAYDEILIACKEILTNSGKTVFVAQDRDKTVGYSYALLKRERSFSDEHGIYGFLDTIYIHPEYRKQGIAKTLVTMCEDWSRKKGCSELASCCDLDNEHSFAFHTAIGFKELHRIIHFSKDL